jgi:hypothetical protein
VTVIGTLCTGCATLFFALIDTHASYWPYGFPSAILSVVGADFVFACGTLFVAKVSLADEQSVAGGLFLTMTQLGTSFGLTISTIVFDRVQAMKMKQTMGDFMVSSLAAFRAAQWSAFGFGMLGTSFKEPRCLDIADEMSTATIVAVIFLRGVGVVGHTTPPTSKAARDAESVIGKVPVETGTRQAASVDNAGPSPTTTANA